MHRLLSFSADLILSFRAQHTRTKGEVRPFGDSPMSMLSFNLQIPEIERFSSDIEIKQAFEDIISIKI
ncbi:hypothetical protein H5410_046475 [Solanum commersonii]|uniref:Uncharacterized protein n=1 Tax=Solanum commersonii TaxID=4109 RepID=A0A9J5XCC5_SOLCO|nr:hypothetical protein H5410_046475 [Solanum commersonii]